MGNSDIIIYSGQENPSSYEIIQKYIKEGQETDLSALDKVSNWFDKIPPLLKVIAKNIDKTGIIGNIDDLLSERKSQKEQERLIISVAFLYDIILKHEAYVQQAMITLKDDFQALTEEYFIRCKESRQLEKLLVFRDIWFNSISKEVSYGQKEYVFSLVAELSIDQINVLKYIYLQSEKDLKEKGRENTAPVGVYTYSEKRGYPYEYIQQICINLSGKGLLVQGTGSFLQSQPTHFLPSSYMDTFIEYLKCCN